MSESTEVSSTFDDQNTTNVVVDALPYIDLGYDEPGVREAVKNIQTSLTLLFNKALGVVDLHSS